MSEIEGGRGSAAQAELHGVLPPGTVLRGYELKSVLGQGAFGITYRALDTTLHRDVAIKEYLPTTLALREGRTTVLPRSPDHVEQFAWGRERFLDEARVLARLDRTSSIIRVFDFLEANGTAYMVMALVEGETLHKRLSREKRLTPEAVERIVFPLLDGLEEVHAATFLHRDIKPANIMLDGRGQPTLIDFGASRAAMAERSMTMTAIFTPGYAAAEQFIASAKLAPCTDIYGLSATLYHAITGKIPPSAVERILNDTYEPLMKLRPEGYSPALLAGIDAGLAVRADDRPQSIAAWRDMLRHEPVSGHDATRVVPKSGHARAAKRSGGEGVTVRGPVLWGAVAAVILLLAGGGWLAWVAVSPANVTTAALSLSAEQLEQALAERRKADMLAAEKRRLEDEARRRMENESAAKQQADQELQQARAARQKAEEELAQLKADIEARRKSDTGQRDQAEAATRRAAEEAAQRKAEAETAAMRQAEEEAQKKAAAEAEAKRLADEALAKAAAERQRADDEARQRAEAEAARRKTDDEMRQKAEAAAREKGDAESQKKAAEAAETGSRLEPTDRQRIQVALSSLGFDTRGSDGVFGPRSREMIEGWQKARKLPPTGFLSAAQQQTLLKEAAPAVTKFDEEQKTAEEAKARSLAAAPAPSSIPTPADGLWRGTYACDLGMSSGSSNPGVVGPSFTLNLEMRLTHGSGSMGGLNPNNVAWGTREIGVSVGSGGDVNIRRITGNSIATLSGRLEGNSIRASGKEYATVSAAARTCTLALTREPVAVPSGGAHDGIYVGTSPHHQPPLRFVRLEIVNGRASGTITSTGACTTSFSLAISATGNVSGEIVWCSTGDRRVVEGSFEGQRLVLRNMGANMMRTVMTRETAAAPSAPSASAYDGAYTGSVGIYAGMNRFARLEIANGKGSGTITQTAGCASTFSLTISATGDSKGDGIQCTTGIPFTFEGKAEGQRLELDFRGLPGNAATTRVLLTRSGN